MALAVYNTLTRRKEIFEPLNQHSKEVLMYVCGVTLYDQLHLGHARAAVVFDVIRSYLEHVGYRVKYVTNFTDVDDKMIQRANQLDITVFELASQYIEEYFEQMDALRVRRSLFYPRATENIKAIIALIQRLQTGGFAYAAGGDVFFRTRRFSDYGKLSGQSLDNLLAGARITVDTKKEDPVDFALWKHGKEGEPSWDSPWGKGRPGWHIECSAMAMQYLGESIDIHGGGQDLIFPHHENEIAQSEAATGKPFVKYWIHNGLLTINEQKMAKSLGNFISLAQALRDYPGEVIRLYLLSAHYRSGLDLSSDSLSRAQASLEKLYDALQRIDSTVNTKTTLPEADGHATIEQYRHKFFEAMDDDFNTPAAIAVLFELVREATSVLSSSIDSEGQQRLAAIGHALRELGQVLGLLQAPPPAMSVESHDLIEVLVEVRSILRREGNYQLADHIRTRLADLHVALEDTHEGTSWRVARELEEPLDKSL